jgi:hypothetical protein
MWKLKQAAWQVVFNMTAAKHAFVPSYQVRDDQVSSA